ncbi:hypothetical protein [Effusibacillus consociatus]|uniref:Uncharacterized protein n=1 Tax=Effusibacillus consociatus TaxID=1117041 RepID=A0ABV9Q419_9BACL
MEANVAQLRSELTKLQIEVNMLRQMMGSLARAEQSNVEMMQDQANPNTFGAVGNLMPIEQQTVQQLEQMKQLGNELKQHVDHLSQLLLDYENRSPDTTVMSDPYSRGLNDPMQRTY